MRASGVSPGEVTIRSGRLRGRDAGRVPVPDRVRRRRGGRTRSEKGVTGVSVGDEVFGAVHSARRGQRRLRGAGRVGGQTGGVELGGGGRRGGRGRDVHPGPRPARRRRGADRADPGGGRGTGSVAVQFAVAWAPGVIGTAGEHNHDFLRSPRGRADGLRAGAGRAGPRAGPGGVDAVIDCAGGALPDLIAPAGDPARVVTIADFTARDHGVHLSPARPTQLRRRGRPAGLARASRSPSTSPRRGGGCGCRSRRRSRSATSAQGATNSARTRHARGKIVLLH